METPEPALQCAVEILEIIPVIMGSLRCQMRRDPANALTIVQFRVLAFLDRHKTASLSQIADHLGLGLPTTSKIVDGLVNTHLVERNGDPSDRRRVSLELNAAGRKALGATRSTAQKHLARMLAGLTAPERARVVEAMQSLRSLFVKKQIS
jgi:DNA-binding MarR family transcriptional regulator